MGPSGIDVEATLKKLLKENNDELYRNLATKSDMQCLYDEFANLKIRHEELSQRVVQLESRNKTLEDQFDRILQKSTEANLVVRLDKSNPEVCEDAKAICAGLLNESNIDTVIESAYRIRTRNTQGSTVIVKMKSRESAWNVLKNSGSLKGKKISIQKDLPPNVRQRRAKLLRIRKMLLQKDPREKISVRDDSMVIQGKVFTWDSVLGLKCGENDGFNVLKSMFGDFSALNLLMNEFLNQNNVYNTSNLSKNDVAVNSVNSSDRQNLKVTAQLPSLSLGAGTSSGCVHEA